ncbi:MULTI-COPPER OXIDASE [Salix koriyanagi]|uniref:MULTI-COPPER OXIDASE n=1 Tax=Salix koriyanagi TaxID=2511006 RepID=A0A9Q0TFN0_9ROSI|nr:MULTI-COPPER OXIDASE [Salix koriyanagi]
MHKAAGGFGGFKIASRSVIPRTIPPPAGDFTILAGDWFKMNHTDLKAILDGGSDLPFPDGLLINGRGSNGYTFTVDQGKTYRLRISNVGLTTSINFRIQGHKMLLVEVEGTHSLQNTYDSLDIHLGQSYSVLVTADQAAQDYFIVVSTRFTSQIDWSLEQARSLRYFQIPVLEVFEGVITTKCKLTFICIVVLRNLTASGPRPNPQGSYHYGLINTTHTVRLQNSAPIINGKQRYAVNSVSFIPADTPLKLADHFNIPGVFSLGSISDNPTGGGAYLQTSVMAADFRGMDGGQWSPASRLTYNLRDTISRCTVQVYPASWTAVYMPLDNVGMWNVRSENWARQYLGQQFYLRVYSPANSWRDEFPIPHKCSSLWSSSRTSSSACIEHHVWQTVTKG